MAAKNRTAKSVPEHSGLGLERIVFFSDAVMAIAITLMAIDLKIPEAALVAPADLPAYLSGMAPRFVSFFISFAVIGIYWTRHHHYFSHIKRQDTVLIVLNLLFLMFIAAMPFVASLLGQYGSVSYPVAIYAGVVTLTGFSISALWWYASHNYRLVDKSLDIQFIRMSNLITFIAPLIFMVSIPLAFLSPVAAMAFWWASPLISFIVLRISKNGEKQPGFAKRRQ